MTTEPWHGPSADFPSGSSPQPGTVSNVICPQPIRTGLGFSSKTNGAAATSNVRQTQGTHFFTDGLLYLDLVGIGLFSAPQRASECTPGCGRVSIQWRKRRIKEPVRSWLA